MNVKPGDILVIPGKKALRQQLVKWINSTAGILNFHMLCETTGKKIATLDTISLKNLQKNLEKNIPMYTGEETSWETTTFILKVIDNLKLVNYNGVAKIIFLASKFLKSADIWFCNNYASLVKNM
jgi:hypothetical protein